MVKMKIKIYKKMYVKIWTKIWAKYAKNGRFSPIFVIGVSVETAEYSVPNIRLVLAEYSAEYSVFGRTLNTLHVVHVLRNGFLGDT